MRAAVVAAAALALAAGCAKGEEAPRGRPAPIAKAERERGERACQAYLERLCACAKARPEVPDLQARCELKRAKGEALALALAVDDDPSIGAADVFLAQDQARKIIGKCIEENVALDRECP